MSKSKELQTSLDFAQTRRLRAVCLRASRAALKLCRRPHSSMGGQVASVLSELAPDAEYVFEPPVHNPQQERIEGDRPVVAGPHEHTGHARKVNRTGSHVAPVRVAWVQTAEVVTRFQDRGADAQLLYRQ